MDKPSKKARKKDNVFLGLFLKYLLIFSLIGIIVFAALVYHFAVNGKDYLDYSSLGLDFSSVVYYTDSDGNQHEYEQVYGEQNRIWASYDEMPKDLLNAFVAIEDERFFKHHGFDLRRTVKATLNYVFNRSSAYGGSTINQQIVKNITGEKETTAKRKIVEIVRAVDMDRKLDKKQILEIYANTIYLSQGCYGVKTAAEKYFGKDVSELSLAECASIAGITQYPAYYDPLLKPENNKKKQETVLRKMLELGYISDGQYENAKNEKLNIQNNELMHDSSTYSYFTDQVISDVIEDLHTEKGISKEIAQRMIYSGGLQIYSTVNPEIQNRIDEVFESPSNYIKYNEQDPIQAGMAVMDPYTGAVLGLGGGLGEKGNRPLNHATQVCRQPGSSIKPLSVYGPGFDKKVFSPSTYYTDKPYTVKKHTYKNQYRGFKGRVTVRYAVQQSINTVAIQCLDDLTLNTSYDYLKNRFRISSLTPADRDYSPLGVGGLTKGISPLEMTAAYCSFVNEGIYTAPYTYTKVCDVNGNVLLEKKKESGVALSKRGAATTLGVLKSVVTSGTGTPARLTSGTDAAGKTGTTDDDKDRWFAGLTPYYVSCVWVGFDQPKPITGYGVNPAISLWKSVLDPVHSKLPKKQFDLSEADNSGHQEKTEEKDEKVKVCIDSGLLATSLCENDYRGSRVEERSAEDGDIPTASCNLHDYVSIDTSTGMIANSNCPLSLVEVRIQPTNLTSGVCTVH